MHKRRIAGGMIVGIRSGIPGFSKLSIDSVLTLGSKEWEMESGRLCRKCKYTGGRSPRRRIAGLAGELPATYLVYIQCTMSCRWY